jgi:hypothetical protein
MITGKKFIFIFSLFLLLFTVYAEILIVNDDAEKSVIDYYTKRLNGFEFQVINKKEKNPDVDFLNQFKGVFWITGNSSKTLTNDDKELIKTYISKNSKKGLFIEGEKVMYDSAFIDYGFFYRNIFNSEYGGEKRTPVNFSVYWANPITWGMRDNFVVNTIKNIDIINYRGFREDEVLFKIDDNNYPRNSIKSAGIGLNYYRNNVVLLSFSPAVRKIWEIDTSNFVNNLAEWLTYGARDIVVKLNDRAVAENQNQLEKYYEMLAQMIINSFNNDIYEEFDYIKKCYDEQKIKEEIFKTVCDKLLEKYYSTESWQNTLSIKTRMELLK